MIVTVGFILKLLLTCLDYFVNDVDIDLSELSSQVVMDDGVESSEDFT